MSDTQQFADLVFEGGGVKGIAFAGALAALKKGNFTHKSVAGTSAGAITAALVAAGYSSKELDAILLDVPFAELKDRDWIDRLPAIGHLASAVAEWGIYEGKHFQGWMVTFWKRKASRSSGSSSMRMPRRRSIATACA